MPKLVHRLPLPRFHRPSGQARVRIAGQEYWLGAHGSSEAQAAYDRLIGAYLANGRRAPAVALTVEPPPVSAPPGGVTITVLIAEFRAWAKTHYRAPDGTPTREADNFRSILRRLRKRFGKLPVEEFGPIRLLELRSALVKDELARRTINSMMRRVRQVVRWGVSRELVPVEVLDRLATVEPLEPGRGGRETTGSRGAVDWTLVEATLPSLPPLLQAFVTVAYHSGARRGELARLTTGMIDRSKAVWTVDMARHKTAHHGHSRRFFIGPRAQLALEPWLLPDAPDEPIFSPLRVDDRQPKRKGKRPPGRFYSRSGLEQALRRAIDRAGVERWTLGQLRHSAAVRITDAADLETARQALGHTEAAMTRHYAAGSTAQAIAVMSEVG